MRINFGCGKQTWPDWFCIDAVRHPKASRDPDLLFALAFNDTQLVEALPLADGCADELHSYHFIEHVYRWEAPAVLAEWHRLLRPGGLLVLELPNLEAACRNLLAGARDQMGMWPIYGDWGHRDPYMMHKHGYTPATIQALVAECGFTNIRMARPQTHKARSDRDMRLEARK